MSKLIDLTGQDFGYWHVLERAENDKKYCTYVFYFPHLHIYR